MLKKNQLWASALIALCFLVNLGAEARQRPGATTESIDWDEFLSRHDMTWDTITADPIGTHFHTGRRTGYYAGAIMGNGLLGTNLYKLCDGVYRLNAGRSDVTEARPGFNLFNAARLPIGYFTITTAGRVEKERMRLSLYNAETRGTLTTDRGSLGFRTYVHADELCIVFETESRGGEDGWQWDFVPQQAVSPRAVFGGSGRPADYLNHEGRSNPDPVRRKDGEVQLLIQPLAADSGFVRIVRHYVVAWREAISGNRRRIIATVAQADSLDDAVAEAEQTLAAAFAKTSAAMEESHRAWWHDFYRRAAFVSLPEAKMESFYWAQYYKFASTARPGRPIVDLQGVWPTYDTTWPAIWMNLNIQLTYSWLTKANLGELAQPLWDAFWQNRDNLTRNVTDIPSQRTWTECRVMPRSATYDMLAPLDPALAQSNQYEVGNLTWTLFYCYRQCTAYADTAQMRHRLFPLLKSAVNTFFRIRTTGADGRYHLPPTASPEYGTGSVGPDANYDLANLRWGLTALLEMDSTLRINDPMRAQWQDFLDKLAYFPYDEKTGFKVSRTKAFTDTTHRHYSHLFMIYPYHLLSWADAADRRRMELSVGRWHGNQGYSRTGKAAMLATKGDGSGALRELHAFFSRYLRPNTLYNETGPVIETPLAAMSSLHELYLQDHGDRIRVFNGCPAEWKDAAFIGLRAHGAFLVSATRRDGRTVFVQVESEQGGHCRLQTGIPTDSVDVRDRKGRRVKFRVINAKDGVIEFPTKKGSVVQITNSHVPPVLPAPLPHSDAEANPFGDGRRMGN